jgi:hypothetical protein
MLDRWDVGVEVINLLCERLAAEGEPVAARRGGLLWQPRGLTQGAWAEALPGEAPGSVARVVVRSECVRGLDPSSPLPDSLFGDPAVGALSALVQGPDDPSRLHFVSALHVSQGREVWASEVLFGIASLQAARGAQLAARTREAPGRAAPFDPPRPTASGERLSAAEIAACRARLAEIHGARVSAMAGGLTARIPTRDPRAEAGRSLLIVEPGHRSEDLGAGLLVTLTLLQRGSPTDALALNETEAAPGCPGHLLGGWTSRRGLLTYSSFCPDGLYVPGLALELVAEAARRTGAA